MGASGGRPPLTAGPISSILGTNTAVTLRLPAHRRAAPAGKGNKMKKLGFGLMRLPRTNPDDPAAVDRAAFQQMADTFLARGGTYFDTAYPYHGGASEGLFGEVVAARYPRRAFEITSKMPIYQVNCPEDYGRIFQKQLDSCRVDYFDNYLLHSLGADSYEKVEQLGGFAFLSRMQAAGKIRRIGFSYHDGADFLDRVLTEHPEIQLVQLQINYVDWEDPVVQARRCYEVCVKHRRPVAVMEPLKGGALTRLPRPAAQLLHSCAPAASLASWGLRYAAGLPGVEVVLSGMGDLAQLEENLTLLEGFSPLNGQEQAALEQAARIVRESTPIPCTSCGYCTPSCPKGIPIPDYFSLYNRRELFGMVPELADSYRRRCAAHAKPQDCIGCGGCEARCPQHLPIRQWLGRVARTFESEP